MIAALIPPRRAQRLEDIQTSITTGASNARGTTDSTPSAAMSRVTRKTTKKSNTTARETTKINNMTTHPVPRAKHQRARGQPEDSSTSSGEDAELFDEMPLTRADIPKIVEPVMNQFSAKGNDSSEEIHSSPHLGK